MSFPFFSHVFPSVFLKAEADSASSAICTLFFGASSSCVQGLLLFTQHLVHEFLCQVGTSEISQATGLQLYKAIALSLLSLQVVGLEDIPQLSHLPVELDVLRLRRLQEASSTARKSKAAPGPGSLGRPPSSPCSTWLFCGP